MTQQERTEFYLNESNLLTPINGDSWAFYDGVWHYQNGRWYFPQTLEE